jgi:3-methylcrotonyl-CoA carboxylase alpha subunit
VLGDQHGHLIHLGERDCSVQRRHQKVIEESPAPSVTPALRAALGEAALRVAGAAGYSSAGTCEFLLGGSGQFWFIEMNARLQVEHPVTEFVTGIDLVRAQIEIAAGQPLRWSQDEIRLRGHAIECRLYAEDPAHDDRPSPGRITRIRPPLGPGLRHDNGYADGDIVPPFYDTMLGKLIASGEDRTSAIRRARAALDAYVVEGIPTNRPLLAWILDHETFQFGAATTDFLGTKRPSDVEIVAVPAFALAAAVAYHLVAPAEAQSSIGPASLGDWRIAGQGILTYWQTGADARPVSAVADRAGWATWLVAVGRERFEARVVDAGVGLVHIRPVESSEATPAVAVPCRVSRLGDGLRVDAEGQSHCVRRASPPTDLVAGSTGGAAGRSTLEAPLPGRVVKIAVAAGDEVRARQPLVIVEAMKIETAISAPRDGVVAAIRCTVGEAVSGGQVLVELAPP